MTFSHFSQLLEQYKQTYGNHTDFMDDGEYFTCNIEGRGAFSARTMTEMATWLRFQFPQDYLSIAHDYARRNSGCLKVVVGAVVVQNDRIVSLGTNLAIPDMCRDEGCLRILKFGDDYKTHRGPTDCRAIHSEVQAICNCAKHGVSTQGATIYVTRYPCEGCARQIVAAGITKVVYGRQQEISEMTKEIFDAYNIECVWDKNFDAEDTTR